jgi:4-amino-4-deoxychorismate synthase (2-amino-4-deoxychorismate-forming) component II
VRVLLIDNFDSFTYNLYQFLSELGAKVEVIRNNAITIQGIKDRKFTHIVISPGPGDPGSAGITLDLIKNLSGTIPILGVCLGHQAIGQAFGGIVARAPRLMHGKVSQVIHDKDGVFKKIPQGFNATRYHSLIVKKDKLPKCLKVTAKTKDGIIMGLRHKKFKVEGVQFHPESIMTDQGKLLLKNFLKYKEPRK